MPTRIDDERQDALLTPVQRPIVVDAPKPKPVTGVTLAVIVAMVVGIALVWPRGGEAITASPTAQPATAVPTSIPPTPQEVNPYIALIEQHIADGKYRDAMTTAEAALAAANDDDRQVLTRYIITAGLNDIYTTPPNPLDRGGEQRLVDVYLSLQERARIAGVTIDTPIQVARSAHASSHFTLARVALEEAYAAGDFNPNVDRDITRLYASTLYGLGEFYTADKDAPLYTEGLRWLVTSDLVADHYRTGQVEAEALLTELVGPTDWPKPMEIPLK